MMGLFELTPSLNGDPGGDCTHDTKLNRLVLYC